jgi:cell division protein FtsI (penicillin-binding protein 3)
VIEGRLVYVQVIERADLEARARDQQQRVIKALPMRGDILDRNGHPLATSADTDSIFVDPSAISHPEAAVQQLCEAFADCSRPERQSLLKKFSGGQQFAWVRRQVTAEQSKRVGALGLAFVGTRPESRRFYPNRELAAHVLGWVGLDNDGLGGIEYAYNKQIRGKEGRVVIQTDAHHKVFSRVEEPPVPGASLELTLDEYLQHVTERELQKAIVENRAAAGSAIVVNPHTGEILAMANEPTFDLNNVGDSRREQRRNRAVEDLYEPGSTFKLVTASAAIENHVIPIDALIDTSPGHIKISNRLYRDTTNHGVLSFADVIADSSNVGAIKIGFKVGRPQLSAYIERFGFGKPVSSDFPAESAGMVWPLDQWTDLALASMSIGYQVGVTPLQMVGAVSAIANGGVYVEPRVVRAIYRDGRRQAVQPKVVRRSISAETAAVLTRIMEGVVEHGTGKPAQIAGYTVAGKTGTAKKLINGRYSNTEYNASFVGFVPSERPAIAIIVVLDSPHARGYYGGTVSAPVFQRIAVAALRYLGIAPTVNPDPPVLVPPGGVAVAAKAGTYEPAIKLVAHMPGTVPDVRGMSARDAMRAFIEVGMTPALSGDGFVVKQKPEPGTPLTELRSGLKGELTLARVPPPIEQPEMPR